MNWQLHEGSHILSESSSSDFCVDVRKIVTFSLPKNLTADSKIHAVINRAKTEVENEK